MPAMRSLLVLVALAALVALVPAGVSAVDRSKFRSCAQTRFCARHRDVPAANRAAFEVSPASVWLDAERREVRFELADRRAAGAPDVLDGSLRFVLGEREAALPAARVQVRERLADPQDARTRWTSADVLTPAAEATRALRRVSAQETGVAGLEAEAEAGVLLFAPEADGAPRVVAALRLSPFGVDLYVDGERAISTNGDQQFHYEVRRDRHAGESDAAGDQAQEQADEHEGKTVVDYGEDGLAIYSDGTVQKKAEPVASTPAATAADDKEGWEESFGGHTDKKRFGPSSIGLDVAFHGPARVLYGIPEHASDFVLKDTLVADDDEKEEGETRVVSDPYRLYNLDVFEYELDVPMALYGSIPVLVAPNAHNTVGMFWNNPSETFVDISTTRDDAKKSHWMSESGVFDLFLLAGPSSADFFSQYTALTGRAQLPPLFAVAYHQCRWNYKNEADVDRVDAGFDEHLIPYDVLWLDIDHTDGKKYFTWDEHAFPTPDEMQKRVARTGRKMVTIVDPHIKVSKGGDDYYIHKQAEELGLFIKDEQGKDFRGWCWPGDSSYIDFTSPKARTWWSNQFRYENYQGSTPDLFTWNDMNEPSVFNGPEVSMRKGCLSLDGVEHREWHNLYGMLFQRATMEGQLVRQLPLPLSVGENVDGEIPVSSDMERPFVLSRAFFAGSQRYGAVWTGDNTAEWGHLEYATKMLLSMSVTGLTFVGADIGGFFGDPSPELLTRWYQSAIYQPFFRGHAHHDSPRREPWVHGEPHTSRLRAAIRERYAILPYVYTLFRECAARGQPVMRPLWMHFPQQPQSFSEEDEFLLGPDLLVKPIVQEGVTETSVFLPSDDAAKPTVWYSTHENYKRYVGGSTHSSVPAPIDATPVFHRGGSVVPRKNRVRRSSALMRNDPITLVVALDADLAARGSLYLDDERTLAAELEGVFAEVSFTVTRDGLRSRVASPEQKEKETETEKRFASVVWVEKVEIYGFGGAANVPQRMLVDGERVLEFTYDAAADRVVVRKPMVLVTDDWDLRFEFDQATS